MNVTDALGPDGQPTGAKVVELAAGEPLGNFIGPMTFTVPMAPGNREWDELNKPPYQLTTGLDLIGALTDPEATTLATKAKPRDLWNIIGRGNDAIPRSNSKIKRIATALGITVDEWYSRPPN